jgi:hypothetical protein
VQLVLLKISKTVSEEATEAGVALLALGRRSRKKRSVMIRRGKKRSLRIKK